MVTHDPSLTSRTTRNIIIADGELINETVAKALPWLRHRHMMEFSKIAETLVYPARTTIISRDEHVENFFMIHKGEVEVVLQDRKQNETIISRLKPGEFFGEIELLRGGKSIANVRAAADGPVELLTIKRGDFRRVLDQSPITAEAVGKIVQEKLEIHRAADSRTNRPLLLFRRRQ
jgi:CRP-like cAMP-binding protein